MAKVITFSRYFPYYHPRKGEPTNFVEKIWRGLSDQYLKLDSFYNLLEHDNGLFEPKWHTIRGGKRWQEGDIFSPRVWSGQPYKSKQIQFAPDTTIEKIFDIYIANRELIIDGVQIIIARDWIKLAKNNGLNVPDLEAWFKMPHTCFSGQIICWNKDIQYP